MEESKTNRVTPPTTPTKATPSQSTSAEQPMGLSSPELIKELKQPHTLKHVPMKTGVTTVVYGQGQQRLEKKNQSKMHPNSIHG
ncbi:hypothetical protein ABG768_016780 [Culter alburnus]|uniref:Uncharacterized protein n=1 Tax=Culter alburnus TaxID=194366 RepID=A0AAW1Z3A2_CULAL